MTDRPLGGFWGYMIPMPLMLWQKRLFKRAEKIKKEHV